MAGEISHPYNGTTGVPELIFSPQPTNPKVGSGVYGSFLYMLDPGDIDSPNIPYAISQNAVIKTQFPRMVFTNSSRKRVLPRYSRAKTPRLRSLISGSSFQPLTMGSFHSNSSCCLTELLIPLMHR